jgi:nucleoside-diphosphate-sugar epimerase
MGNHALIFGASGITGWAIVNAILEDYPEQGAFDKVTALTNRSLSPEVALWPRSDKLQVVSGIDLGKDSVQDDMKSSIKDIETVSHAYFFGGISSRF